MHSTCESGPLWFRQRTIGKAKERTMRITPDFLRSLNQESTLHGHDGCVNCLEWNSAGDRLASGSDDSNIIIWDPFKAAKQKVLRPGHRGIIFSVKFMPSTDDLLLASGGNDCQVRVTNLSNSENLLVCDSCHTDRVKRLAVHPSEPNMIWSAAEDGLIVQYDTRHSHVCNTLGNVLLDLNSNDHSPNSLQAKCIAVNPLRSEMIAVGTNDIYNRLFDRRYLKRDASISCTAYLTPGHLPQTNNRSNRIQSYGTTYLSFNSTGSQLLASVHAEQIYLYNTYEPNRGYRSFEASIKPLLLGSSTMGRPSQQSSSSDIYSLYKELLMEETDTEGLTKANLTDDLWLENFCKIDRGAPLILIKEMNKILGKGTESPDIYRARAVGLINRGWRGDSYQALRDCCRSLALEPLNFKTIRCLAQVLIKLGYRDSCLGLLEMVDLLLEQNPNDETLLRTQDILDSYKRSPSPTTSSDDEIWCSRGYELERLDGLIHRLTGMRTIITNAEQARKKASKTFDFGKRFCGHSNMNTDIKEANFFGDKDEFIVGGSDDGAFYIWDASSTNIIKAVHADDNIVNCVQPHPNICILATSGIESSVKLWSLSGKVCQDVEHIDEYSILNNEYISTDPLDAMLNMLQVPENRRRSAALPN